MSYKLKPKQKIAAKMYANGLSGQHICARLSIHRETLLRWRKLPAFQQEMDSYSVEMRQHAAYRMESLIDRAFLSIYQELDSSSSTKRSQTAFKLLQMVADGTLRLPQREQTSAALPVAVQEAKNSPETTPPPP